MFVPPLGTLSGGLFVCHLGSMCPISHRDSVGFSPADRTLQVNFPFILHIECHRRFPTAPVEHNVHVDHLLLVPPPPSCGRERGIKHHLMDDALSGIHRTSLEPRGGNEPPRPRRCSHGCGLVFCSSTRHIWRIPSLHAPPGAAAFYVSAHPGQVIAATASASMTGRCRSLLRTR